MKTHSLWLLSATLLIMTACKKGDPIPFTEKIKKVWTVQTATENGTVVFTKGSENNIRNYANYQLDLSNPPAVTLTEVDGTLFRGDYEVQGDSRLKLRNLRPQPTGSGGQLTYTVGAVTDRSMELAQSSTNLKTGNTLNIYRLSH